MSINEFRKMQKEIEMNARKVSRDFPPPPR